MNKPKIVFAGIRYETVVVRTSPPDPHPDVVLGAEREAMHEVALAMREHLDREFMRALIGPLQDVTPNTLEQSDEGSDATGR